MDQDQRVRQTPPRPSADNVKLFAKHGPWWMILCMLVERFPYKSALTILSSIIMWRVYGR